MLFAASCLRFGLQFQRTSLLPLKNPQRWFRSQGSPSPPLKQLPIRTSRGAQSAPPSLLSCTAFVLGSSVVMYSGCIILMYENRRARRLPTYHYPMFALMALNGTVFLAHKVPALAPFMRRYFFNSAQANRLSMLGSCFSHLGGVHLAVNMYVLSSFLPALTLSPGGHNLAWEKALGLYLAAGLMGALASKAFCRARRLATLSLGASGCVFGLLAASVGRQPDARLGIVGLSQLFPDFHFRGVEMLAGFAALEVAMLVLRPSWVIWDSAAHLGGMFTGAAYVYCQRFPALHRFEHRLLLWWRKLRGH